MSTYFIGEKEFPVPVVMTPAISIRFRESCRWFKARNLSSELLLYWVPDMLFSEAPAVVFIPTNLLKLPTPD